MANKKNRIRQDIKGEWYCTECGKAGFKSKQSGNSHLTSCSGISGLSHQMVTPGHHQATTTTTTPLSVVSNPAFRSAISAMIGSAPTLAGAVDGGMEMMRVQNAELMNRLENVELLAGNHIGHLSGAMAGPVNFFESPTFKWVLVGLGVIALFFLLEKGDAKTKQTVGSKILDLAIKKI
jgi:hypothetical protein